MSDLTFNKLRVGEHFAFKWDNATSLRHVKLTSRSAKNLVYDKKFRVPSQGRRVIRIEH